MKAPARSVDDYTDLLTAFDPEAPNSQQVKQAQRDAHQELQELEDFAKKNADDPTDVATAVFLNQDQEAQREADRQIKKRMGLLAAAFTTNTEVT